MRLPLRRLALAAACALGGLAHAQPAGSLDQPGDVPLMRVSATGVQVYECRAGADGALGWTFREPRAVLTRDGAPIGRHYAGPTWEHGDGSRIVGRAVANRPAPQAGDIPWLRLAVTEHGGEGALGPVTAVQRVATHGGTLAGPCAEAGARSEVPYTADYVMLRASTP